MLDQNRFGTGSIKDPPLSIPDDKKYLSIPHGRDRDKTADYCGKKAMKCA